MKRIVIFALLLNAALLGVIAHQLVAIAGGGEPVATRNGDTNGDGARDIGDAIYLLQWLFAGGDEPVPVACAQEEGGLSPEQEEILSHMSIVELPMNDAGNTARTIRFTGVNVQVVNGTGSTDGPGNGLGNLVAGYQELREDERNRRLGSHNLVVGKANNYTTWGGQVVGERNTLSGHLSTVTGGYGNLASGRHSTVSGGIGNTAGGEWSVVSGGSRNTATGIAGTVGGGWRNEALGANCIVSGGAENIAARDNSTVGGGSRNEARGAFSTVSGGWTNVTQEIRSTVSGGAENEALGENSTVSGGRRNSARDEHTTVSGGYNNTALGDFSVVSGGRNHTADGEGEHLP